jgi:hypothetical protein
LAFDVAEIVFDGVPRLEEVTIFYASVTPVVVVQAQAFVGKLKLA